MTDFVFHAHSGLRYLVLLAAVVAIVYFTFGWLTRQPYERGARIMMAFFAGLLDLQIVLGILLVLLETFYPALIGHIVMMLLAAVMAHGFAVASRRTRRPERRYPLALGGVLLAFGAIISGILAIGRPVL